MYRHGCSSVAFLCILVRITLSVFGKPYALGQRIAVRSSERSYRSTLDRTPNIPAVHDRIPSAGESGYEQPSERSREGRVARPKGGDSIKLMSRHGRVDPFLHARHLDISERNQSTKQGGWSEILYVSLGDLSESDMAPNCREQALALYRQTHVPILGIENRWLSLTAVEFRR